MDKHNITDKIIYYMDLDNILMWIKKLIVSFFIFIGAYLSPMYVQGIAILCFIFADAISGMWVSYKGGYKITFKVLKRTISKIITYGMAMVLSVIFTEEFGVDLLTIVAFGLASIELTSVFKNLSKIVKADFVQFLTDAMASFSESVQEENDDEGKE